MAAAKFGADRVPQELHDFDPLLVVDAVGAGGRICARYGSITGFWKSLVEDRKIDQGGRDDLFHDLPDPAVSIPGEYAIACAGLRVRQHGVIDPGRRVLGHGIGEPPEQVAPGDDLAEHRLIAAEFIGAGRPQRFGDHADEKVELYSKPRAALELDSRARKPERG